MEEAGEVRPVRDALGAAAPVTAPVLVVAAIRTDSHIITPRVAPRPPSPVEGAAAVAR